MSGGTAGYSFDWGGGIVSQNRSNLTAGNYSSTVTDANGCTTFIEKTITEPAAALIATATSTDVLCNGAASGTASTLVTGGNGGLSYSWTTGGDHLDPWQPRRRNIQRDRFGFGKLCLDGFSDDFTA